MAGPRPLHLSNGDTSGIVALAAERSLLHVHRYTARLDRGHRDTLVAFLLTFDDWPDTRNTEWNLSKPQTAPVDPQPFSNSSRLVAKRADEPSSALSFVPPPSRAGPLGPEIVPREAAPSFTRDRGRVGALARENGPQGRRAR